LLLAGHLPFDHEFNEMEIARMTIKDAPPFGRIWKKLSPESRDFVESIIIYLILELIVKDPTKRMELKDILDHPWLEGVGGSKKKILNQANQASTTASKFKTYASADL